MEGVRISGTVSYKPGEAPPCSTAYASMRCHAQDDGPTDVSDQPTGCRLGLRPLLGSGFLQVTTSRGPLLMRRLPQPISGPVVLNDSIGLCDESGFSRDAEVYPTRRNTQYFHRSRSLLYRQHRGGHCLFLSFSIPSRPSKSPRWMSFRLGTPLAVPVNKPNRNPRYVPFMLRFNNPGSGSTHISLIDNENSFVFTGVSNGYRCSSPVLGREGATGRSSRTCSWCWLVE